MSIDHLLARLGLREEPNALEAQIQALRREMRRIGRTVSTHAGQAAHVTDDWSDQLADLGQQAVRHGAVFADIATHQAQRGARALGRDPLPAIALIGTALLLGRLFRR